MKPSLTFLIQPCTCGHTCTQADTHTRTRTRRHPHKRIQIESSLTFSPSLDFILFSQIQDVVDTNAPDPVRHRSWQQYRRVAGDFRGRGAKFTRGCCQRVSFPLISLLPLLYTPQCHIYRCNPTIFTLTVLLAHTPRFLSLSLSHSYRIPGFLSVGNGTLLVVAEARRYSCSDETPHDLVAKRSTDGGKTWGSSIMVVEPGVVWGPQEGGVHGGATYDPVPVLDRNGVVHLIFSYCPARYMARPVK